MSAQNELAAARSERIPCDRRLPHGDRVVDPGDGQTRDNGIEGEFLVKISAGRSKRTAID